MKNGQVFNSDYSFINPNKIRIITCDTWVAKVTLSSQRMFADRVTLSPWRSVHVILQTWCSFRLLRHTTVSKRGINCWRGALCVSQSLPWLWAELCSAGFSGRGAYVMAGGEESCHAGGLGCFPCANKDKRRFSEMVCENKQQYWI